MSGRDPMPLLLAQDRLGTFVGLRFTRSLDIYVDEVVAMLQRASTDAKPAVDYETLAAYVDASNLGSLVQHLAADPDGALAILRYVIHVIHKHANKAGEPRWNVLISQPVVNAARLFRTLGNLAECRATLGVLYRIVVCGEGGTVLGVSVPALHAREIPGFDLEAERVVRRSVRIEALKCALVEENTEWIRSQTDGVWRERPTGWQLEMELRLKAELASKNAGQVLSIVEESSLDDLWVMLYVLDALSLRKYDEAYNKLLRSISDVALSRSGGLSEVICCSLGIRAAGRGLWDLAHRLAHRSWELAASDSSEVGLIRAGTLLSIVTERVSGGPSRADHDLWPLLQRSRQNYERLLSCTAISLLERTGASEDYAQAVDDLLAGMPGEAGAVHLACLWKGGRGGHRIRGCRSPVLSKACPGAEWIVARFAQMAAGVA